MDNDYYLSRKRKLLKEFDKTLDRIGGLFVSRYGEDSAGATIQEARQEYEALIPQLPYIGGRQPHTQFLISTAWFQARRQGTSALFSSHWALPSCWARCGH